jgi:hypothetical protein
MKTKFIIPALFFFSVITVKELKAQDKIKIIAIDFQEKKVNSEQVQGIKKGDWYRIEVNNINTYLYQVFIDGRDSSVQKAIKVPGFGDFGTDAILSVIKGLNGLGGVMGTINATTGDSLSGAKKFEEHNQPSQVSPSLERQAMGNSIHDLNSLTEKLLALKARIDDIKMKQALCVFTAQQVDLNKPLINTSIYDISYFVNEINLARKEAESLSKFG